jgi:hypothetical protein
MSLHFRSLKDVPEAWQGIVFNELRKQNKITDVQDSDSPAKQQRRGSLALDKEKAVPRFTKRVSWTVHQFRHRLCDGDNARTKELQDSFVDHGLIANDTLEEIEPPTKRQTKIAKEEVEYTEITIETI